MREAAYCCTHSQDHPWLLCRDSQGLLGRQKHKHHRPSSRSRADYPDLRSEPMHWFEVEILEASKSTGTAGTARSFIRGIG